MTGLDDSRVHRAHRDLVQARALGLKKLIGRQDCAGARRFGQGMLHRPAPMVQPRPSIGKPGKLETEQITRRPLQARCRGVERCQRGHLARARVQGSARDLARGGLVQHALHRAEIPPQSEQVELALAQGFPDRTPHVGIDRHARPALMRAIGARICEQGLEHQMPPTRAGWPRGGTRRRWVRAGRRPPRPPAPDAASSAPDARPAAGVACRCRRRRGPEAAGRGR